MLWPKQLPGIVSLWLLLLLFCLLHSQNVKCFIVPEEVQSLSAYFIQNIPQIKKGTDSRFGFGFRLGKHADFQLLLELGPQNRTRPLGIPEMNDQSFSKRKKEILTYTSKVKKTVKKALQAQAEVRAEPSTAAVQQLQQLQQLYKLAMNATASRVASATSGIASSFNTPVNNTEIN